MKPAVFFKFFKKIKENLVRAQLEAATFDRRQRAIV
jgi:hypothetical protein